MSKRQPIQITIPQPCNEAWAEMTPVDDGRFCGHCQKKVIDFTTWSDAALYQFFSKQPQGICGQFFADQIDRPLYIPPQPNSRLYRMTVALGLTLLFTQAPHLLAQNRPPKTAQQRSTAGMRPIESASWGSIYGMILDDKKEQLLAATVHVYQGDVLKGSTTTNVDGQYEVKPLEAGFYDVLVVYPGYDSFVVKGVQVTRNAIRVNATLSPPLAPGDEKKLYRRFQKGRMEIRPREEALPPRNYGRRMELTTERKLEPKPPEKMHEIPVPDSKTGKRGR
ncbi:MAG: carboxypeptidase-like regulatory domain-containing protein [Bacteroidota bacterium]